MDYTYNYYNYHYNPKYNSTTTTIDTARVSIPGSTLPPLPNPKNCYPRNKNKSINASNYDYCRKKGNNYNKKGVVKLSTDPQSVAARERRHRISERFKTLQKLVPGGAKLDTVSMLDKAIQYVKFLKSQIFLHQTILNHNNNNDENNNDNNNNNNNKINNNCDNYYDYDSNSNKGSNILSYPWDIYDGVDNNNNNNENNNSEMMNTVGLEGGVAMETRAWDVWGNQIIEENGGYCNDQKMYYCKRAFDY